VTRTSDPMSEPKTPPQRDEASDLPEEIRRKLDALDAQLETIDHYALLGIPRGATRAQVRSAFLVAAPPFHPDKYFGRKISGEYGPKMQRVFARMAMAHDMLLDDERRAKYDRALPPPLPPPPPPVAPSPPPPSASDRPPDSRHVEAPPASTRHPSSSTMRAAMGSSPEFDRTRAQAFATRLAGSSRMRAATPVQQFHALGTPKPGTAQRPGTPANAGQPIQPKRLSSSTMPAVDPKAAVDSLRRRYEEQVARQQPKPAQPSAADQAAAKEATRVAEIAKAKEAEGKQEYAQAAVAWVRAFDAVPTAETANRAALCFRRAGTDLRRAAKYGEEAVKIDPNKATYRVTLALAYADAGLVLRARGEIERALALDPQNASVKEASQKIKAMKG
jgi:curved DNA-binding protein CbpA